MKNQSVIESQPQQQDNLDNSSNNLNINIQQILHKRQAAIGSYQSPTFDNSIKNNKEKSVGLGGRQNDMELSPFMPRSPRAIQTQTIKQNIAYKKEQSPKVTQKEHSAKNQYSNHANLINKYNQPLLPHILKQSGNVSVNDTIDGRVTDIGDGNTNKLNLSQLQQIRDLKKINLELNDPKINPKSIHHSHHLAISDRSAAQLKTPVTFKKDIDSLVDDNRLLQGYKDINKGDNTANEQRYAIYKQDFEIKLGQMNNQLQHEVNTFINQIQKDDHIKHSHHWPSPYNYHQKESQSMNQSKIIAQTMNQAKNSNINQNANGGRILEPDQLKLNQLSIIRGSENEQSSLRDSSQIQQASRLESAKVDLGEPYNGLIQSKEYQISMKSNLVSQQELRSSRDQLLQKKRSQKQKFGIQLQSDESQKMYEKYVQMNKKGNEQIIRSGSNVGSTSDKYEIFSNNQDYNRQESVQQAENINLNKQDTGLKLMKDQEQLMDMKLQELVKTFLEDDHYQRMPSQLSQTRSQSPSQDMLQANSNPSNQNHQLKVKAAQRISSMIKGKSQFFDICKNYTVPLLNEKYMDDAQFNFFKQCNKELVVALPTLSKIQNKVLILSGYKLNQGVSRALEKGLSLLNKAVQKVILDDNGLDDDNLSCLLRGISAQEDLKALLITRNQIDKNSVALIQQLLQRGTPRNLDELRITECKIAPGMTTIILQAIKDKLSLRKLSLVNASLTEHNVALLKQIVEQSRSLIDLDVSWNELRPQNCKGLLEALSKNRNLQYLNLSWNNLQNKSGGVEEQDQQKVIVEYLGKLIKYNKNIIHIDLSYTGLKYQTLKELGSVLRRARSLLAIHFSGNPGITSELKEYLSERIRCKKQIHKEAMITTTISNSKVLTRNSSMSEQIAEGLHLKLMLETKRLHNPTQQIMLKHHNHKNFDGETDKLIFMRWLGHKVDMPGSGQWQMIVDNEEANSSTNIQSSINHNQCWICDKWIYTLIFWSKSIGYQNQIDIHMNDIQTLKKQIEVVNKKNNISINKSNNNIGGTFNHWLLKSSFPIVEYCKQIDMTYVDPFQELKKQGKIREGLNEESECNQKEQNLISQQKQKIDEFYKLSWKDQIIKYSRYKKVHYQNSQAAIAENDADSLFILPCFVKPGKNFYSVFSQSIINQDNYLIDENQEEIFFHKFIAPLREEEVPIFVKQNKVKVNERVFKKETSVFRDWKEDTANTLEQMFEDDQRQWKIFRFIKSEEDRKKCEVILKNNFVLLKKIYTHEICRSAFPNIGWIDFSNFCEKCNLYDKNLGIATIDRLFIATNVVLDRKNEDDDNPDKALCRYEFMEILLRIAQAKYKDPGICQTFAESLEKLLYENIFPYANPDDWQEFRDNELWVAEVNDVLEANLFGIKQIYEYYFEPRKKFMDQTNAINLMMKDTSLGLLDKEALHCYGMCKMSVILESENAYQYSQLKFVELLEMIGRIAKLKFQSTELDSAPLATKIEYILDILLRLVEIPRKEVNIQIDAQSESDDEY